MKKRVKFSVFIIAIVCVIVSCDTTKPSDSEAPTVAITYPTDNSEFPFGTEVTIVAEATDNEEVKGVRFYVNDEFVFADESEPFEYNWNTIGTRDIEYTFYAKAYDTSDNKTLSDAVSIMLTTSNSDNFGWCDVPAGDYTWGEYDEVQNIDYDFQIMKYEVTNMQYAVFLTEAYINGDITVSYSYVEGYYIGDENNNAGDYPFYDLNDWDSHINWNGNNFIIETDFEDHPVVEATWFGAWAFAQYYGLRLPTEQEWEKAARGDTGNDYPWGNVLSGDRANYRNSGDPWDNGTTPVGYYNGENGTTDSPSLYGVYDMCGNVFDWTDSWYNPSSSERVIRGGYWDFNSYYDYLCSWGRNDFNPESSSGDIGFRCAVTR